MVPRSHFMHPAHALVQNLYTEEYLCGGCKTDGNGTNFGCEPCSFHMHEFCSNCPRILHSFLHPEHPLHLMINSMASPRICDVCEDTVEGLFYWCETCEFNVHPLCTQFPQFLYHAVHYPPHPLKFQKSYKDAPCWVCKGICKSLSWRYRCGSCDGFDVHVECVAKPYHANSYDTESYETTSRRLPPWAGLYTPGGASSTANSYNNNIYNPACANDQTAPPYNMYNPAYGGVVPFGVNTHSLYHSYGGFPYGTCAHQPNMYNPFNSNSQHHVQNHHGTASCSHLQAPPQNAQTMPSQGQGSGKLRKKVFGILEALTLGVVSNVIFGTICLLV